MAAAPVLRWPSLYNRLPSMASVSGSGPSPRPDTPRVSALFLVDFDPKAGYTIAWWRAGPNIRLEDTVEYKSLPSGLHAVPDDLVYFIHDSGHAGLSAFINLPCNDEGARNARMISVGILVPLSLGRLGRAWRHADALREIARLLGHNREETLILEQYWEVHGVDSDKATTHVLPPIDTSTSIASPALRSSPTTSRRLDGRHRSNSDGTTMLPRGSRLCPYHPAWSLPVLLDTFGPLIFPICRAALLRRRILLSCHAPVRQVCDFVYAISVLSNIPLCVTDMLPKSTDHPRLRPLFTIGVHDIPFLAEDHKAANRHADRSAANTAHDKADGDAHGELNGTGWIACTTDSILAMKHDLWDMLVTMPPPHASNATARVWPTVESPHGHPVRASQRDLRRFRTLRIGLARLASPVQLTDTSRSTVLGNLATRLSASGPLAQMPGHQHDLDLVAEPLGWTALAYNGFMWWASAGEQIRAQEQEESSRDAALLAEAVCGFSTPRASIVDAMTSPATPSPRRAETFPSPSTFTATADAATTAVPSGDARQALAIIAYFHRMTTQIFSALANAIDDQDPCSDRDDNERDDSGQDYSPSPPLSQHPPRVRRRGTADIGKGADDDLQPLLEPAGADQPAEFPDSGPDVRISSAVIEAMGLDLWSVADAAFIRGLAHLYFSRTACVESKSVDICGVRLC